MPSFTREELLKTKAGARLLAALDSEAKKPDVTTRAVAAPPYAGCSVTLPYPPSANNYWRSVVIRGRVRVLVSSEARKYKKACEAPLRRAFPSMIEGPIWIDVRVYRPIRRGDLGNRIKVLEDAMQGFAYANDDQIVKISAERFDDKLNPRVEVTVRKANPQTP
jgi:crossover junction endodeoxyribonuclease RusA